MYEKNLIIKPQAMHIAHHERQEVKGGTWPPLTYMSNEMVPGCPFTFVLRWIWEVPEPNDHMPRHSHSNDELLMHIGTDHHNPEDLGAEYDYVIGDDKLTFNKTSALYIPKGVEHNPTIWKRVDRPHLELAVVMGKYD